MEADFARQLARGRGFVGKLSEIGDTWSIFTYHISDIS